MKSWMVRPIIAFVLIGLFSSVGYSQNPFRNVGNWWREVRTQFRLDTQRNNALPQPFAVQDQATVHDTFSQMYAQGAVMNRILDSVHFDPATNELNNAGRTRLREILAQQKPLDIQVASTLKPDVDNARIEKLKSLLANYSFPGHRPQISSTFHLPHHNVGSEEAAWRKTFLSSQPAPKLQSVSGEISGSAQ